MADHIRIEIAFDGGQVVTTTVPTATAEALELALAGGTDTSFPLDAEDGRYTVALRRVVWIKRFARESRVGFGA